MTDTELTEACSRGDSKAWRVLMARFKGLVRSMVVKMAASESHLWDDIEQDCWLAMHQNIGKYDAERGTLENFVWGVLNSAILDGAADRMREKSEISVPSNITPKDLGLTQDTVEQEKYCYSGKGKFSELKRAERAMCIATYPDDMTPEDGAVRKECVAIATDAVLRVMPKMRPKAREAIGLYLLHGLRGGQIANKMGISTASVEDLLAEGQRVIDDSKVAASL